MKPNAIVRATLSRDVEPDVPTPASRGRRRSRVEVARFNLFLNIAGAAAVEAAQKLGHRLTCRIDGTVLTVEAER